MREGGSKIRQDGEAGRFFFRYFSALFLDLFLGTSFFHGDVGYNSLNFGNTDKLFVNSKLAVGLNFRKNFNPRIAFNVSLKKGTITSYDKDSEDLFITQRNLDFKSRGKKEE